MDERISIAHRKALRLTASWGRTDIHRAVESVLALSRFKRVGFQNGSIIFPGEHIPLLQVIEGEPPAELRHIAETLLATARAKREDATASS